MKPSATGSGSKNLSTTEWNVQNDSISTSPTETTASIRFQTSKNTRMKIIETTFTSITTERLSAKPMSQSTEKLTVTPKASSSAFPTNNTATLSTQSVTPSTLPTRTVPQTNPDFTTTSYFPNNGTITTTQTTAKTTTIVETTMAEAAASASTTAMPQRLCEDLEEVTFESECVPCESPHSGCLRSLSTSHYGSVSVEGAKSCRVSSLGGSVRGCRFTCRTLLEKPTCCKGFWGDDCLECPGGYANSCNDNGDCEDHGSCTCEPHASGIACEKCVDQNKYGQRCNKTCGCVFGTCLNTVFGDGTCKCHSGYKGEKCDQPIPACLKLNCSKTEKCVERKLSMTGHQFNDTHAATCITINRCVEEPQLCSHEKGVCKHTGPNTYKCTCEENFHGDGTVCLSINPCKTNRGGCSENEYCKHTGPNMPSGKEIRPRAHSNRPQQMQRFSIKSAGGKVTLRGRQRWGHITILNNRCRLKQCFAAKWGCTCKEGYTGDGDSECLANILQTLLDLDVESGLGLDMTIDFLKNSYEEELTKHGPFTIFVPIDKAFRNSRLFTASQWSINTHLQILRQHMLIGAYKLSDLQPFDKFYTLEGNAAELKVNVMRKDRKVFKFKLSSGNKAKILKSDIRATNGIIHIVNNVFTYKPIVEGDYKINAMQLLTQMKRHYKITTSLIKHFNLEDMFNQPNVTIFAVKDEIWNKLPPGLLDFFKMDKASLQKMKVLLSNHVCLGKQGITHLVNMPKIVSMANYSLGISVNRVGQLVLDNQARISQANIPVRNGFVHNIDAILLPSYIDLTLPNFCSKKVYKVIPGRCTRCKFSKCAKSTDVFKKKVPCKKRRGGRRRGRQGSFCRALCIRKEEVSLQSYVKFH
ncbi:stabilin-2 [Plakobranchus ocellatus]|uniref:Stabilin-2 n=1 Tax=Plakobranchus ocellatus TaxID=259542 RepID=A0AAV4C8M0_9GAST|nr:stabilin-2 [Plakobranchus ocellatus]